MRATKLHSIAVALCVAIAVAVATACEHAGECAKAVPETTQGSGLDTTDDSTHVDTHLYCPICGYDFTADGLDITDECPDCGQVPDDDF